MVLKAEEAVYGGYVLSRGEGVVFIRGAIPGEVVEVALIEKKRDYSVAAVTGVVEPSSYRVEPPCRYFGDCGGCQLQFAAYEEQLSMKNMVLEDCLRRIAGFREVELAPPLTGASEEYRQRAQFKVNREGGLGFYREGTRDVVPVTECPLMVREINEVLARVAGMGLSGIREVHVTSGDSPIALIKGRGFDKKLAEEFIESGLSGVAFEDNSYKAKEYVRFDLNGLEYTVSPWSFFQSNWELNVRLVRSITQWIDPSEGMKVLDLYAGAGNFSLPLAEAGAEVVAVEENPHAIKDGERNLSLNKISGFRFIKARAERARLDGSFDVLILDPPRPGLAKEAVEKVLRLSPERIVYVSCNPSTFARDLKKLMAEYDMDSVRMVDLFPHTYHVESLAFLRRKDWPQGH